MVVDVIVVKAILARPDNPSNEKKYMNKKVIITGTDSCYQSVQWKLTKIISLHFWQPSILSSMHL